MITVQNLGKCYKRYPRRWARLGEWVTGGRYAAHESRWVLRGVSFGVAPGEAIGIIGHNGAGKSTLLKILTGTTRATEGAYRVDGRISALLELGLGFHPDFTGRQNAVMGCQMLGLRADEIQHRLPEIVEFAGIADYIDQPLRAYSTGMHMRLAFSVATVIRPELLIIDEALAVGDIFFQLKCQERIRGFVAEGTTLLFVSHSGEAILRLCSRALLLRHGALIHDGPPKEVIDLYQADLLAALDARPQALTITRPDARSDTVALPARDDGGGLPASDRAARGAGSVGALRTDSVTLAGIALTDPSGRSIGALRSGSDVTLTVRYHVYRALRDPHVGFKIRDRFGTVLFETNSYTMGRSIGPAAENQHIECRFTFPVPLAPGEYSVTVGLANGGYADGRFTESLSYLHDVTTFTVVPNPGAPRWAGICDLNPQLSSVIS